MVLLNYNNIYFEYKNGKFDLNEIYKILEYDMCFKDYYVTKEDLINYYLDYTDQDFIDFLNNVLK